MKSFLFALFDCQEPMGQPCRLQTKQLRRSVFLYRLAEFAARAKRIKVGPSLFLLEIDTPRVVSGPTKPKHHRAMRTRKWNPINKKKKKKETHTHTERVRCRKKSWLRERGEPDPVSL